jgi:hypothetical protein
MVRRRRMCAIGTHLLAGTLFYRLFLVGITRAVGMGPSWRQSVTQA